MNKLLIAGALLLGGSLVATPARADDAPATYAIVIGSNAGGPGQADLRYAEDDARKMGAVLTELGGFTSDKVDIITHPTPDIVRDRLAKLATRVTADVAAGRQTRVFFYYSGHARATAIDLGSEQLSLEELRARLFDVPATLTVVVLDACQSGAFSRVKGASPAADFSYSSKQHLDATGVAVLASSSGSELSQESEQLKGSYFTHNLLVGMRGAGDLNGDGQVTVDEAYRYAYHQTLLATAETAVGGQHVTFEADLKGHGEVPLSYPRAATKTIELPAALEGKALVEDKRARAVVAETFKAKGAAVRIAVAPGDYRVIVRQGDQVSRCDVSAGGTVDLSQCTTEKVVANDTKGGERWWGNRRRLELDLVAGSEWNDDYAKNLRSFGYFENNKASFQGTGLQRLSPYLWVGGMVQELVMPEWTRGTEALTQTLDAGVTTAMAVGRGELPLGPRHRMLAYAQLAGGLGVGRAHFSGAMDEKNDHTYFGPAVSASAGFHYEWTHFGLSAGYQLDYAPVVKDLIGNTHASGGQRITLGLTWGY